MPVNARDPNDPLSPLFPQYPQSYPVTSLPSFSTVYQNVFSILPLENQAYGITPGYNTPPKKFLGGLPQPVYDFRDGLIPPRVTPRVPPAKIPPSPVAAVTSPALYNNVNFSNLPKLKIAGNAQQTTVDIYQQIQ
jgi:hypothetical protein